MRYNIEGIVKRVFNDVWELVQENKDYYTDLTPELNIFDKIHDDNKEAEGNVCGIFDIHTLTISLSKDDINEVINRTERDFNETVDVEGFIVNVLAHEMCHYLQFMKGEKFDMKSPYHERWHELEAQEVAYYTTNMYLAREEGYVCF